VEDSVNFADEPYVRVYKRKTTTLAVVGWQARAVLRELFLIVDKAGVFELDGEDAADAVTAVLGDIPVEVVRDALDRLTAKGCIQLNDRYLVVPKFREAQESAQSDRLRAKETRARRRADAMSVTSRDSIVTGCDSDVTSCDETITARHSASQRVTQYISQCSTYPNAELSVEQETHSQASGGDTPSSKVRTKPRLTKPPDDFEPNEATLAAAREVGANWRTAWQECKDWADANGKLKHDWQATLRGWMRRSAAQRSSPRVNEYPGRERQPEAVVPPYHKPFVDPDKSGIAPKMRTIPDPKPRPNVQERKRAALAGLAAFDEQEKSNANA
jgi:hypothetical protein